MARRSFTSSLPAFRLMRAAIAMGILVLLMLWARAQVNATLETIPPASELAGRTTRLRHSTTAQIQCDPLRLVLAARRSTAAQPP